ncbi:MAG: GNAT family N-acetyltransferase [Phocaeicola sp.]
MALLPQNSAYRLRAPEPEDLECLCRFENEVAPWGTGGDATGPYSKFQMRQYLANSSNNLFEDKQLRLLIEDKSHKVVGIIDLFDFNPMHNRAEVGIIIDPTEQQKGIATIALKMLEEHAFNRLGIHQLYAYIHIENQACRKLFRNSGFKEAAHLTDWVRIGGKYATVILVQKVAVLV